MKFSPTQNMTILVETPIAEAEQLEIGMKLMAYDSVFGEQTGFISEPKHPKAAKAMRMMAGEFCGNATLSLATWVMAEKGMAIGEEEVVFLEVSGATDLVRCEISRREHDYLGRIAMPLPTSVGTEVFTLGKDELSLEVVHFEGITHVVVPKAIWQENYVQKAEEAADAWAEQMADVFGILVWDAEKNEMFPLVSVRNGSRIWERGCGSGTCAVGICEARKRGESVELTCEQVGGEMGVVATMQDGAIVGLQISGSVRIVAKGTAYL